MPEIFIDGHPVQAKDNQSVLEAALAGGHFIPYFCWHPKLSVAGNTVEDTTLALLSKMNAGSQELISLYYGCGMDLPEAERIAGAVRAAYPDQQTDLLFGGQPHYFIVIGVE